MTDNDINVEVKEILPTPIGFCHFSDHQKVYDAINTIVSTCEFKAIHNMNDPQGLIHYEDPEILSFEELKDLKEWIIKCATIFITKKLGYQLKDDNPLLITKSWFNITGAQGRQQYHNHANAYISGTYYVNQQPSHPPISFQDLRHRDACIDKQYLDMPRKRYNRYFKRATITPTPGDVVLWESQVVHGYDSKPNQSGNRISLSFNLMPKEISNNVYGFTLQDE
jgi:uncharacterized protein (TIGR02466 family)